MPSPTPQPAGITSITLAGNITVRLTCSLPVGSREMSLGGALPGRVFCRATLSAPTVGWGLLEFSVRKTLWGKAAG